MIVQQGTKREFLQARVIAWHNFDSLQLHFIVSAVPIKQLNKALNPRQWHLRLEAPNSSHYQTPVLIMPPLLLLSFCTFYTCYSLSFLSLLLLLLPFLILGESFPLTLCMQIHMTACVDKHMQTNAHTLSYHPHSEITRMSWDVYILFFLSLSLNDEKIVVY